MCMYMRKNRNPETYSVLWFLLGCLAAGTAAGAIFANLTWPDYGMESQMPGIYLAEQLKKKPIASGQYVRYLCSRRLPFFLVIAVSGLTGMARLMTALIFLVLGLFLGAAGSMALLQHGVKGFGIFIAVNLPHGIVYFLVLLRMMVSVYEWNGKIIRHVPGRIRSYVTMAVIGLLCWIAGILLEAYVNPMILKYLLL